MNVLVIGSLNMDVTLTVESFPRIGETIFGKSCYESCGGKGGNQAVAAATLGLQVFMMGKVGNDSYGDLLIQNLKKYNIDTSAVVQEHCNSGRAFIQVDNSGKNTIVVIPGGNFLFTEKELNHNENTLDQCQAVILQNEIPLETVFYSLQKAKEKGLLTIYNPAPAKKIDADYFRYIDYLIVNEVELQEIFQKTPDDLQDQEKILQWFNTMELKNLIVTLGEKGSVYINNSLVNFFSPFEVQAVDTTAAGDTFIGAFTYKILQNKNIAEAMHFASAASALTVSKQGAQEAIPSLQEVENFLNYKR